MLSPKREEEERGAVIVTRRAGPRQSGGERLQDGCTQGEETREIRFTVAAHAFTTLQFHVWGKSIKSRWMTNCYFFICKGEAAKAQKPLSYADDVIIRATLT